MSLVRHVEAIPPEHAKGRVAEVYAQVNAEFSSIGPAVRMLSPSPELTSAAWALMRESQFVGDAPPLAKASVVLGVGLANGIRYDVDGARAMVNALGGEPDETLLAWGRSTGDTPTRLPAAHTAEYVGTALFSHFIGRVGGAMLPPDLSPGSMREEDERPFEGAPVMRELTAHAPGASLPLLADNPPGELPGWAGDTPIGRAYACLAATAALGRDLLGGKAQDVVTEVIAVHKGRMTPDVDLTDVLSTLDEAEQTGAKVAILAGLAPQRITDADVAAWRASDPRYSDHCTVFLLSYGAMAAVEHIAADLA